MLRGNEQKKIFLCDEDRKRFIETLREKGKENEFSVLAYCLMDNHVHLLIREGNDQINRVMKRIGVSYVSNRVITFITICRPLSVSCIGEHP